MRRHASPSDKCRSVQQSYWAVFTAIAVVLVERWTHQPHMWMDVRATLRLAACACSVGSAVSFIRSLESEW
jgi:hypothetical protein